MVSRAQGTIEYLVILAVVVVLSLVVVGIATNILGTNSTQVGTNSNQLSNKVGVGGISVTEVVADSSGDALISFKNVSGGNLTLTKITPINSDGTKGNSSAYSTPIVQGDSKTFSLNDINTSCPCNTGETTKTCSFQLTVVTADGLEKVFTTSVTTNCSSSVVPADANSVVGLGEGTITNPWVINSCLELQAMNEHLDGNYALGADINCADTTSWNSGNGFAPVGLFTGSLNGGNHTVSGFFINRSSDTNVGLFSRTSSSFTLTSISFTDANIIGGTNTGGLMGYTKGTISSVTFNGTISGSTYAGGIVGRMDSPGVISNSSSSGSLTCSGNYCGGLVGYVNSGASLTKSFSASYIASNGGLVGANLGGTVSDCYFIGSLYSPGSMGLAGGVVGTNTGTVTRTYFAGAITTASAGGVVGYNLGTVSSSFAVGPMTVLTNPPIYTGTGYGLVASNIITATASGYWDITLTGRSTCCSGAGSCTCTSTTNQASSYYGASGIPFANLSWSTSTWKAVDTNYPILSWQ